MYNTVRYFISHLALFPSLNFEGYKTFQKLHRISTKFSSCFPLCIYSIFPFLGWEIEYVTSVEIGMVSVFCLFPH